MPATEDRDRRSAPAPNGPAPDGSGSPAASTVSDSRIALVSLIVMALVGGGFVAWFASTGGQTGALAAGSAAAACLIGAVAAYIIPIWFPPEQRPIVRSGAGLLLRAGLPLGLLLWARSQRPEWMAASLLATVIAVYAAGLIAEITLRIATRR